MKTILTVIILLTCCQCFADDLTIIRAPGEATAQLPATDPAQIAAVVTEIFTEYTPADQYFGNCVLLPVVPTTDTTVFILPGATWIQQINPIQAGVSIDVTGHTFRLEFLPSEPVGLNMDLHIVATDTYIAGTMTTTMDYSSFYRFNPFSYVPPYNPDPSYRDMYTPEISGDTTNGYKRWTFDRPIWAAVKIPVPLWSQITASSGGGMEGGTRSTITINMWFEQTAEMAGWRGSLLLNILGPTVFGVLAIPVEFYPVVTVR